MTVRHCWEILGILIVNNCCVFNPEAKGPVIALFMEIIGSFRRNTSHGIRVAF